MWLRQPITACLWRIIVNKQIQRLFQNMADIWQSGMIHVNRPVTAKETCSTWRWERTMLSVSEMSTGIRRFGDLSKHGNPSIICSWRHSLVRSASIKITDRQINSSRDKLQESHHSTFLLLTEQNYEHRSQLCRGRLFLLTLYKTPTPTSSVSGAKISGSSVTCF